MKKFALLLLVPLLIFGFHKITNALVSISTQKQSQTKVGQTQASTLALFNSGKSIQLSQGEKIIAAEQLAYDKFLVIGTSDQYIETAYGSIHAPVKIWIISHGTTKLLKVHNFQEETTFNEKVDVRWDSASAGFIDIQFQVEIDGLNPKTEIIHTYIDIENESVLATSSWTTESPELILETAKQKYNIRLLAKDDCRKQYTDSGTGLLINHFEMKFTKGHPISCLITHADGGGEPFSNMPGIGTPSFRDGHLVSFDLPWGTSVDINVEKYTVHSKDFFHDYSLPAVSTASKDS